MTITFNRTPTNQEVSGAILKNKETSNGSIREYELDGSGAIYNNAMLVGVGGYTISGNNLSIHLLSAAYITEFSLATDD